MKQKVIGFQFVSYEKDGQQKSGYRFHLVSETYSDNSGKIQGQLVDTVYISTGKQALIDEFIKAYNSAKYVRVSYNKFGTPECLLY